MVGRQAARRRPTTRRLTDLESTTRIECPKAERKKEEVVTCGGPRVNDTHRVPKGGEREKEEVVSCGEKGASTLWQYFVYCFQAVEVGGASLGR